MTSETKEKHFMTNEPLNELEISMVDQAQDVASQARIIQQTLQQGRGESVRVEEAVAIATARMGKTMPTEDWIVGRLTQLTMIEYAQERQRLGIRGELSVEEAYKRVQASFKK